MVSFTSRLPLFHQLPMKKRTFILTSDASNWRTLLAQSETQLRNGYPAIAAAERWDENAEWRLEVALQFERRGRTNRPADPTARIETPMAKREAREPDQDSGGGVRTRIGVAACGAEAIAAESYCQDRRRVVGVGICRKATAAYPSLQSARPSHP